MCVRVCVCVLRGLQSGRLDGGRKKRQKQNDRKQVGESRGNIQGSLTGETDKQREHVFICRSFQWRRYKPKALECLALTGWINCLCFRT